MAAGKRDIEIIIGDDYSHVVTINTRSGSTLTPINITGRTYEAEIKKGASQPVVASFTCTVTNGAGGEVTITLSDTVTNTLTVGCYRWYLRQNASGVLNTILRGKCDVVADKTV